MEQGFLFHTKVCFFDLDGCVYHGDRLSQGIVPLLHQLRQRGISYAFLTNNSRLNGLEIKERLAVMGMDVLPDSIFTVTDIAGTYIKEKYGNVSVKTIGSASLARSVEQAGHRTVSWNDAGADVVVIGRDTEFHYGKLQQIAADIMQGACLIATNGDLYHPGVSGERIPETGSLLAAIEAVTGVTVECIGKPEPYMFHYGMKQCGVSPENCVMVGDNLDTDILGSIRAGLKSVWITNCSVDNPYTPSRERITGIHPDIVVNSMEELYRIVAAETLTVKE
ncbi:HAD-IIA family hydrolase [Paenibacillus oralis]|uniref:HAD-IIA family hydrolase n=1 Tax=Paenibacillus oralis TaxID=2490856 RepID=UPI0015ADFBEA|nr:HAD-IIA family hydrolase [Paenibacillus oralis]